MGTPQAFRDYIVRFRKGDRIYSTGDPGTEMYIVQNGAVEIFQDRGGRRVSHAVMEKGDFFGEMALIESSPHSACAEALSECELIEINSTLFDKMIKANSEIAVRMLRKLSMRLRDSIGRIEEMSAAGAGGASTGPALEGPDAKARPSGAAEPPAGPPVPDPRATFEPAVRPAGCHAVFQTEEGREVFFIVGTRAAIGRFDPVTGLKPEVDVSPLDLHRSVSRHHARLTFEGGVYAVTEEVGALNGTFVNGKKLVSGKPARLRAGDTLSLGMVKLVFKEVRS